MMQVLLLWSKFQLGKASVSVYGSSSIILLENMRLSVRSIMIASKIWKICNMSFLLKMANKFKFLRSMKRYIIMKIINIYKSKYLSGRRSSISRFISPPCPPKIKALQWPYLLLISHQIAWFSKKKNKLKYQALLQTK